jgi:hypothetical protein
MKKHERDCLPGTATGFEIILIAADKFLPGNEQVID